MLLFPSPRAGRGGFEETGERKTRCFLRALSTCGRVTSVISPFGGRERKKELYPLSLLQAVIEKK
jgi:hypothetical protein